MTNLRPGALNDNGLTDEEHELQRLMVNPQVIKMARQRLVEALVSQFEKDIETLIYNYPDILHEKVEQIAREILAGEERIADESGTD